MPMLDFEFYIDTGNSPLVYCQQLVYGFRESKIIIKFVATLWTNLVIIYIVKLIYIKDVG